MISLNTPAFFDGLSAAGESFVVNSFFKIKLPANGKTRIKRSNVKLFSICKLPKIQIHLHTRTRAHAHTPKRTHKGKRGKKKERKKNKERKKERKIRKERRKDEKTYIPTGTKIHIP